MSWYVESKCWIQQMKLDNPGLSKPELEKLCRKNYPFAMRRGYAYKAWLRAMREEFGTKNKDKLTMQLV